MPNYKNGKIYVLKQSDGAVFYCGSTTAKLHVRRCEHRKFAKQKTSPVYMHIRSLNFDFKIELVEPFSCESKTELHRREGTHIRQLKTTCPLLKNCVIPGRTKNEYRRENPELVRKWMRDHRERKRRRESTEFSS